MQSSNSISHINFDEPTGNKLSHKITFKELDSQLTVGSRGEYYLSETNMSPKRYRRIVDEPTQSDKTLVLNIEDLIALCFGPMHSNVANFKVMQLVLHHLARQMRLLEQDVEIRFAEEADKLAELKEKYLTDNVYGDSDKKRKTDEERESDELSASSDEAHKRKDKAADEKNRKKGKLPKKGEKGHTDQDSSSDESREGSKSKGKSKQGATDKSLGDSEGEGDKSGKRKDKTTDTETVDASTEHGSTEVKKKPSKKRLKAGKKGSKRGLKDKAEDQTKLKTTDKSSSLDGPETKEKEDDETKQGKADESLLKYDSKVGGEKGQKEISKEGATDETTGDTKQETGKKDKKVGKPLKGELYLDRVDRSSSDEIYGFERKYERKVKPDVGLTVSEIQRRGGKGATDTVIVVEKGPTTRDSRARLGDIEIVTRSEFELLKSDIRKIIARKGPAMVPTLPEDDQLKSDLTKGTATLPGTMQAMQVTDRVKATENVLTKMSALLTQLALAGAFPPEMTGIVAELEEEQLELARILAEVDKPSQATSTISAKASISRKSALKSPKSKMSAVTSRTESAPGQPSMDGVDAISTKSVMFVMSKPANALIRRSELDDAILMMRNELMNNLEAITAKGTASAERARNLAQAIEEQLEVALDVDRRVDILNSLTTDYDEQLSGFDSGLTTQLQSFYEQMTLMQAEFHEALENFTITGKTDSSAISELKCYHKIMEQLLIDIQVKQSSLTYLQQQLTEDMKSLVDTVETLRDQKADQEEVADALNDKADLSRLAKLLRDDAFEKTYSDLSKRLQMCYEKFEKQNSVWKNVINDINVIGNQKAENTEYLELKDNTTKCLDEIQEEMLRVEIILGEPKAAILARQLKSDTQDTTTLSVKPPAVQPQDEHFAKPPAAEILTLDDYPIIDKQPCMRERFVLDAAADSTDLTDTIQRKHLCKRWVGGSHTMLTEYTTHEQARPMRLQTIPTKHYTGYGIDRRLYMMEEELQPCIECNQPPNGECDVAETPSLVELGGGDKGIRT